MLWKGGSKDGKSGAAENLKPSRKVKGNSNADTEPSSSKKVGFNVNK